MTDTYLYVADLLGGYEHIRPQIVERLGKDLLQRGRNRGFFKLPLESPLTQGLLRAFEERFQEGAEAKAQQYPEWLVNQGLVSLCTIFDVFLERLLDAMLYVRVEMLYGASSARNLELKRLVELGSLDAILSESRSKDVERFGFMGIRERFDYLCGRAGFNVDATFRFDRFTDEAREALHDWNLDRVVAVYKQRHGIVHRDERPIKRTEELHEIYEVFSKLAIDLSGQAREIHQVLDDGSALVAGWMRAATQQEPPESTSA
ncbi:MAG: hypothetical protein ACRD1X_09480 [Vicinamibacteria bacterium]